MCVTLESCVATARAPSPRNEALVSSPTLRQFQFYQSGGGAIRIRATGTVRNCGTIIADGAQGYSSADGGSGGGIWITCGRYSDTTNSVLSAKGGDNPIGQAGGGGGRICVAQRLTDTQVAELAATGACTGLGETVRSVDLTEDAAAAGFKGSVSVAGGISSADAKTYPNKDGTPGTAWFLAGPAPGLMLLVK